LNYAADVIKLKSYDIYIYIYIYMMIFMTYIPLSFHKRNNILITYTSRTFQQ